MTLATLSLYFPPLGFKFTFSAFFPLREGAFFVEKISDLLKKVDLSPLFY